MYLTPIVYQIPRHQQEYFGKQRVRHKKDIHYIIHSPPSPFPQHVQAPGAPGRSRGDRPRAAGAARDAAAEAVVVGVELVAEEAVGAAGPASAAAAAAAAAPSCARG